MSEASLSNISQESQTDSWEMENVVLFDPQKPLKDHGFVFFFYVRKKTIILVMPC